MNSRSTINTPQCAISTKKHVIIHPIKMSCGHSICEKCLFNHQIDTVECKICGEMNKLNIENDYDVNSSFEGLYLKIEKQFQETYKCLNGDNIYLKYIYDKGYFYKVILFI